MSKVSVYNSTGETIGQAELSAKVFGVKPVADLIHQMVMSEAGNERNSVAHTKTRGEVRGGGKKPWKQKGTGRARVGSIRSPIWRGGGTIFGPRGNRNFSRKINQSQHRRAIAMVLSDKLASSKLFVIDKLPMQRIKTKDLSATFKTLTEKLQLKNPIALVILKKDQNLEMSARNMPAVSVLKIQDLSVRNLLVGRSILILQDALPIIEKNLSK